MAKQHIGELKQDPENARKHTPRNVGMIVDALHEVGAARSIVIDENDQILAGNATIEAAAQAGIENVEIVDADGDTIVAVRRSGLTPEQKKRLAYFDNRTAELAEWDAEQIFADVEAGVDFDGLFSDGELEELIGNIVEGEAPEAQVDKAEELQEKWRVERGQVWQIGDHRLMCGDATSEENHERLLNGSLPDAVVTDPPYGVGIDYESYKDDLATTELLIAGFWPFVSKYEIIALTPGIPAMWLYPKPSWLMVWVHPAPSGSCPWGFGGTNPILVYGNDPYLSRGMGRRPDSLVLATDRGGVDGHPTPKPISVWSWLVERVTPIVHSLVLDPFLGSGTTMVAAQQLNRICYGMEIEPKYCAVTLERMSQMDLVPELVDG